MCSKEFPFIVRYDDDKLVLMGVHNIHTLAELDPEPFATANGWPHCVKMLPATEFLREIRTNRPFWVRKPLPQGTTRWRNRKTRAKHNRIGISHPVSGHIGKLTPPVGREKKKATEDIEPEENEEEAQEGDDSGLGKEGCIYGLLRAAALIDPMKQAGYILCDKNFNRMKIESPQYRLIRHLNTSKESQILDPEILDYVRTNDHVYVAPFLCYTTTP